MKLVLVDVDGTLLTGPSAEALFIRFLMRRRVLGPWQFWASFGFALRWAPRYGQHVWKKNKAYLTGLEIDRVQSLAEAFVREQLVKRLRPEMMARIASHQLGGDKVFLLTGTPDFIAGPLGRMLGISCWRATQCACRNGRYRAAPPLCHPFAEGKAIIAEELCREFSTDLSACIAYADSFHDLALFERVGTAVAVAPDLHIRRLACQKGWEILAQN